MGRRVRALREARIGVVVACAGLRSLATPRTGLGDVTALTTPFFLDYGVMLALLFLIEFFTGVIIDLCVAVRNN